MGVRCKRIELSIHTLCLLVAFLLAILFPFATLAAPDSVVASFSIGQLFEVNSSAQGVNTVASYTLAPLNAANPMPTGSANGRYSFTIEGSRTDNVAPITFTNTGTYQYEIRADSSNAAVGYTYDTRIYTVDVRVGRPNEDLVAEMIFHLSDGSKTGSLSFSHSYTPQASDPSLMVDPPVKKTVSGSPTTASTFTFRLTAGDIGNPMPTGSLNGVKTISILGSGEEDFGVWQYTREGTYFYTVTEVNAGAQYTYDSTVYTITDVVSDVGGRLTVSRTVTNDSLKQVQSCDYINRYNASGTTGPKTGDDSKRELYVVLICAGAVIAIGCILFLIPHGRQRKREQTTNRWE